MIDRWWSSSGVEGGLLVVSWSRPSTRTKLVGSTHPPGGGWTDAVSLAMFPTMTTSSPVDARAHLSKLVARVGGQHERGM